MDSKTQFMIEKAVSTLTFAYAPYSNFSVSACICTDTGQFFSGVNVENSSYGMTICAESSAICQMITAGHKKIERIVVLAGSAQLCSPCGACRQRIFEFSMPNTMVYLCDHTSILKKMTIHELLPLGFKLEH